GDYQWGGKKAWKNLISDPKSNDISPDELKKLIEPHLEKIMKEQQKREEAVSAAEIKSAA
ncbi:MAG: L,D-transpeptidase, partial [Kaistella sp.]